jgi:hypothetical protein
MYPATCCIIAAASRGSGVITIADEKAPRACLAPNTRPRYWEGVGRAAAAGEGRRGRADEDGRGEEETRPRQEDEEGEEAEAG